MVMQEEYDKFAEDLIKLLRSSLIRFSILIILLMLLLFHYQAEPVLMIVGGLLLFGVFELVYRKRHLLEKRFIIPLPGFLEPYLGSVCSRCKKKVGRGNLKKSGNEWVCEECHKKVQNEELGLEKRR